MHRCGVSRVLIAIQYLSSAVIVLWLAARVRAFARQRRLHSSDLILGAVVVIWLLKSFVVTPFIVTSASMEPTLLVKEVFLVNRLSYWHHEPQRGDVVVFRSKALGDRDLVKRIIAIPGDSLNFSQGHCLLNGQELNLTVAPGLEIDFPKIPPGEYFVMGDNVNNSRDSRAFGTIKRRWISGRAWRSLWRPKPSPPDPPQGSSLVHRTA